MDNGKAPFVLEADARITSFVSWHGQIPPSAKIIEDFPARWHPAIWVQRLVSGRSIDYLVGFSLRERWWALVFDRMEGAVPPGGAEVWSIECYDSDNHCWGECYYYWPEHKRWRHQYFDKYGENFGRHQTAQ